MNHYYAQALQDKGHFIDNTGALYYPSLEELKKECGKDLLETKQISKNTWIAIGTQKRDGIGSTEDLAVSELLLQL